MLDAQSLVDLAKSRFEEAKVLQQNGKFEGAIYLSGYAVELMLKRHIIKISNWPKYPSPGDKDLNNYSSFKTHDLDVLLKLSGLGKEIRENSVLEAKWSIVKKWKTGWRYRELGTSSVEAEALEAIDKTRDICNWLIKK